MKIKVKSDLTVIGAGYAGIVAAISAAIAEDSGTDINAIKIISIKKIQI